MSIYYKFLSERDYCTMPLQHESFITVASFKERVFESRYRAKKDVIHNNAPHSAAGLCVGTDLDLSVINAQTDKEYADDDMLLARNTSVLLRRVPGNRRRMPVDTRPIIIGEPKVVRAQESNPMSSGTCDDGIAAKYNGAGDEWDDFGEDLFEVSERVAAQSSKQVAADTCGVDDSEDGKIRALVNTPALDNYSIPGVRSQRTNAAGGVTRGGRLKLCELQRKTPPEGYICHRCNKPGHFIQNCPTNGDTSYDFKRLRHLVGIPRSMLKTDPDGCYKLPSGARAVLQPDEAAFDVAMKGLSSSSSSHSTVINVPPELYCPLCKQVMQDAVLIKCCFQSFCDKCIRNRIIMSKLNCVCGATNVLIDDLLPNVTLRDTIKRVLESGYSSSSSIINSGSASSSVVEETAKLKNVHKRKLCFDTNQIPKKLRSAEAVDVSEVQA